MQRPFQVNPKLMLSYVLTILLTEIAMATYPPYPSAWPASSPWLGGKVCTRDPPSRLASREELQAVGPSLGLYHRVS